MAATPVNKLEAAKLFLDNGVDPHSSDEAGMTILMPAAERSDEQLAQQILEMKTAVNAHDVDGVNALCCGTWERKAGTASS